MNEPININENAHAKIMREMSNYLDECKNKKQDCQCSAVLEFNQKEIDPLKKWMFTYQCDDKKNKNTIVKNVTSDFLKSTNDVKTEIYKVCK